MKRNNNSPSVAILVPCYQRPEYTARCLQALAQAQPYLRTRFVLVDDGSHDDTAALLRGCPLPSLVVQHAEPRGLRATILEFFDLVRETDFIAKIDNDCLAPSQWLDQMLAIFHRSDADILSPNVTPSQAAFRYGRPDEAHQGYRPASIVGGLWMMHRALIDGIQFERTAMSGIKGAIAILRQIMIERTPRMGWVPTVTFDDLGHWSGTHPQHIKSPAHELYSLAVGRPIAWTS